ncbi:hypothetical protein [Streptomyces sp. NPDC056294]
MYYTPPAESALVTRAIDGMPAGGLLLATSGSFPRALHRYDEVEHWWFCEQDPAENGRMLADPARYLADRIPRGATARVVLTRTQDVYTAGEGLLPAGGFAVLRDRLKASPLFRTVEEHPYGIVLDHTPSTTPGGAP